ncbi:MAG: fibrobacter succinogenes major paralogous domain-containing protein, partial [Chitinispirillaceae bacterium]|nr:fibrobacter succinogenes major paralogous domain-containing protein [Chitinispirillaceae bacterium]
YVPDSASWLNIYLNGLTTAAYGIYGADVASQAKYGVFYNWYAVGTGKLAPKGWRVPSDADWDTLENYLIRHDYNYDGTTSGNRIAKSMAAQWDWDSSTLDGAIGNDLSKNNASGFSALPGGLRHWGGSYYSLFSERKISYLWSSTEYDSLSAWHRYLDCHNSYFERIYHHKNTGFAVRVVRDAN